jgi:hypothetical protein
MRLYHRDLPFRRAFRSSTADVQDEHLVVADKTAFPGHAFRAWETLLDCG